MNQNNEINNPNNYTEQQMIAMIMQTLCELTSCFQNREIHFSYLECTPCADHHIHCTGRLHHSDDGAVRSQNLSAKSLPVSLSRTARIDLFRPNRKR